MGDESNQRPEPTASVRELERYDVPRPATPVEVHLDGNLGPRAPASFVDELELPNADRLRAYPSSEELIEAMAETFDVPRERILPTAGSNGAMQRATIAFLDSSRSMVLPEPTFSLFSRFAAAAGAETREVPWRHGEFPVDAFLEAADETTGLVVVVTPNNPNGLAATRDQLERVADATPALLLVDHAYAEYADRDLTDMAVERDDVVVTRTLSKARGLAGARVGCAVGSPEVLENLQVVGNTYPLSVASVDLAVRWLEERGSAIESHVERVRSHRDRLQEHLRDFGFRPTDSKANFVYAHFRNARWIRDALAGMGFGVRAFDEAGDKSDALRITVPGEPDVFEALEHAVATIFDPEAVLLDLETVAVRTGDSSDPGETSSNSLRALRAAVEGRRVGLVSSRGRDETARVLDEFDLEGLLDAWVASDEDRQEPGGRIDELLDELDVERAWLATSSVENVRDARTAPVLPVGMTPDSDDGDSDSALVESGAARRLSSWAEFGRLLDETVDDRRGSR